MQVSKWGNSLAIRLPAAVVEVLGYGPGQASLIGDTNDEGLLSFECVAAENRFRVYGFGF